METNEDPRIFITCVSRAEVARLAIGFSTDWACVSHTSDMLGVCIRIEATKPRTSGIMEAPDRFPNYGSHQVCAVIRLGRNEAVVGRQQVVVGGGR